LCPWENVDDVGKDWIVRSGDIEICALDYCGTESNTFNNSEFIAKAPELIAKYEQQLTKAEEVIRWYAMETVDGTNNKAIKYFKEVSDE